MKMNINIDIRFVFSLLIVSVLAGCSPDNNGNMDGEGERKSSDPESPNIVYILADDLGYGDIGAYGQEKIETPHIDALAENGMTFTRHYSGAPVCAPARYMLMTGRHPGKAYVRGNDPMAERGDVWDFKAMYENPELEGNVPIPDSTVTIAEVLKEAGYRTGLVGKWGLGAPFTEGLPNRQGFDYFYGYVCQRQAHTYYPSHLWKNEERVHLDNELIDPHQGLPEGADPSDPASYARFHDQPDYAAELMGGEALRFIGDQSGGGD
ncbi:Sulfatase, partial [Fodinibius roseus]